MNSNLVGHDRPINRQAAIMFSRAPWWAMAPIETQNAIEKCSEPFELAKVIDLTKPPPHDLFDRRGTRIVWKNGDRAIITGFGHHKKKWKNRNLANNSKPSWWVGQGWDTRHSNKMSRNITYWWVFKNNSFELLRWGEPSSVNWRVDHNAK